MDNQRLLTWAFFGMMAWMTYQAWQLDYARSLTPLVVADAPAVEPLDSGLPELAEREQPPDSEIDAPMVLPAADVEQLREDDRLVAAIRVETDVLDIEISMLGGTLQRARMLEYPIAKDRPDQLVSLLSTDPNAVGLIQSGLRSTGDGPEANHRANFASARTNYTIDSTGVLIVPMTWADGHGISVEKRFRFTRGSYKIELTQTVTNRSDISWRGAEYVQILRASFVQERSMFDVDSYSFVGPIIYDGDKSEKLKRDDLIDDGAYAITATNGWVGAIQHHFVTAVIPAPGTSQRFNVSVRGQISTASAIGPTVVVEPGESHSFQTTIFIGPKLQSQLEEIDSSLKLTVDYGWLTIISQPLFWLLGKAFSLFGNWGVAIISVTVLIKLAFYKLTEASGRSMAKMRNLQPRIKALQERYKDDKQQQSQAMMDLYKREKVNPAAGCLPILIQMPFFLAFYWVLLESVEMRQAPFALWITDLSTRDPFFILPLIMGAAMFFQQRLNPQVGDPIQVKVMQIMPVIFTVFFAFFPSGLVLYWVTNTLLSIAQQWKINQVVEREGKQQQGSKKPKGD
ncbi:MAG: membrane protein insertase YidC [Proteobacteria bacterium]|nr:membrane protein insertase YidC [Pseudomonadota bacterium]